MPKARENLPLPLQGIRVVELARLYPGPLAGMLLAGWGAEVIKVEEPLRPDPMRLYPPFVNGQSAGYLAVNRGKLSLALAYSRPEGRELLLRLLKSADVLIESFRPGVLAQLGLDYHAVRQVNPRIIYASITGYGQRGPYASRAGHDLNYIALSGILASNRTGEGSPVIPGVQIGDVAGGAYLSVMAILAALVQRERSGKGQWLDVSMLDGLLPFVGLPLAHQAARTAGQEIPPDLLRGALACYNVYPCQDGKFVALAALESKFWQSFCENVGHPEWIDKQFQPEAQPALKQELTQLFLSRPRTQWLQESAAWDVCLTAVWDLDELAQDPHIQARGLLHFEPVEEQPAPFGINAPVFSGQQLGAAPELGQHNAQLCQEMGFTEEQIRELQDRGILA